MRTFTRTTTNLQIPSSGQAGSRAMNLSITDTSRIVADYEVLGRDAQNATTAKLTYRVFDLLLAMSSKGPDLLSRTDHAEAQALSKMLRDAFVGASLSMKIAPDGEVWSVLGLGKLRARMVKAFGSMPNAGDAFRQAATMGFLDHTASRKTFTRSFGALPPYPIAPGDSWPVRLTLPILGVSTDAQGTRLLLSRRGGVATVKESDTINLSGAPKLGVGTSPSYVPGASVTQDIHGTSRSAIMVDEASGLPRESTTDAIASGTTTIISTTSPPQVRPMVMRLSSRTTMHSIMEPIAAART